MQNINLRAKIKNKNAAVVGIFASVNEQNNSGESGCRNTIN